MCILYKAPDSLAAAPTKQYNLLVPSGQINLTVEKLSHKIYHRFLIKTLLHKNQLLFHLTDLTSNKSIEKGNHSQTQKSYDRFRTPTVKCLPVCYSGSLLVTLVIFAINCSTHPLPCRQCIFHCVWNSTSWLAFTLYPYADPILIQLIPLANW